MREGYDDAAWMPVVFDDRLGNQGFSDENEFVGYRYMFKLPIRFRRTGSVRDSLKFFLGRVGEFDQVFLNGFMIGQNNIVLPIHTAINDTFPAAKPLNDVARLYVLPVTDARIRWDSVNLLAIRTFDRKGAGGIWRDIPYVSNPGLEDRIAFNKDVFYVPGNESFDIDTILTMRNLSATRNQSLH